jgi:hypothetical protein
MRHVILVVLLLACRWCPACVRAEDITTNDGRVFTNVEVARFEADGIVIKHDGGTNQIAWKELSASLRQRYQTEARKRKQAEIQKLKQDLARAEEEAARLNPADGNVEPQKPKRPEKVESSPARSLTPEGPAKTIAELPSLKPDEIMDATELVQQFNSDPSGADRRYRNKTFRVRGVIERFEPRMFVRKYDVILGSPDRFVRIVAGFDYPNDYRTVFATEHGQKLVGKPAGNQEVVMMCVGQTIVLQGKCKGARDTEIVFTGSGLVR